MKASLRTPLAAALWLISLPALAQQLGQVDAGLVQTYFDRQGENGLSAAILVSQHGAVVFEGAYGVADEKTAAPMTLETLVDVGSVAKQFTAALVLQGVDDGVLALDDKVEKFFPHAPKDKCEITLHQLLTHTSGLSEHSDDDYAPMTKTEALDAIFASPLQFEPGDGFNYSNSGYTLLAAILEDVYERPYTEIARERLWAPLDMNDTGFHGEAMLRERPVAIGYGNGEEQQSPVEALPVQWGVIGNGGVLSTVHDLDRWMTALSSGALLPPSLMGALWARQTTSGNGESYGYGWRIYDSALGETIWHGGTGAGGNTDLAFFRDAGLVSIILSNRLEIRVDPETGQYTKVQIPAREARLALIEAIAQNDPSIDPQITLDRTGDGR